MKKFENKKTEFQDETGSLGYANFAIICLNQIPEGGLSPVEMSKRIKVLNPLQDLKVGETLKIEDADFEILKQCASVTRWSMIHEDIVKFHNYLEKI
jgi:hypothetical protein